MKRTVWKKRIAALFLTFALLLCVLPPGVSVSAADASLAYDDTDVLDDLMGADVNGAPFDITDYPFDGDGEIQVINFVEYCYSYKANMQDNYGLYIYVYNPQGLELATDETQSKIQMAVSYDAEGKPTDYVKFGLQFCDKVESGDYANLFYKFKVIDREVDGTTFADRVNSNGRRYDVSGVELTTYGHSTATEYAVCGTYVFTGYAAGYGPDADFPSTLTCSVEYLESVSLSVKHTFYRSETSALGAGHQNQLDTVYFSVPKRLIDDYGRLQRIKAEWYEYKTKEILVTSNSDFYNAARPYIGVKLGDTPNEYGQYEYVEEIGYSLGIGAGKLGDMYVAQWGWNLGTGYFHVPTNVLYYMFLVDSIEEYDPYADVTEIGGVQSNALYEYIKNYKRSYVNGRLPIKGGTISADLFEDDIDDSRKLDNESGKIQKGYSYYDFDADVDLQTLKSWSETSPSFWDNWINFGLGAAFTGGPTEESRTVAPIRILQASDLNGTDAEIAERLLINATDVDSLKAEYNNAVTVSGTDDEEMVVVLFRFATSDYYSEAVDIIELDSGFLWSDKHTEGQAYIAQESVFFDFDIIQLTFNKDGVYTVIPVVSSPIDIVNSITPPTQMPEENDPWKLILAVVMIVLLLILLAPLLPYVIRGAVWVFDRLASAFRGLTRKQNNNHNKKE